MENKQTVFRKVYVKERLPSESGIYLTNKCTLHFLSGCKRFMGNDPQWWLEEIELPIDDEIEETKAEAGTSMWWHDKGFENGFKACLNMIKYVINR